MYKLQFRSIGISIYLMLVILFVFSACSTEKNTFINRAYHSTTAKYNGYFNAKELIRIGLIEYREKAREDFTEILPVELYPNEEDVTSIYPIVDTAIVKCQKVITKHSMPTSSQPMLKKDEHAKWIDYNWLMIGQANYIRRDYEKALKTFEYVGKFYTDKPSKYWGELWKMKTEIVTNDLTNATRTMQKIEQLKLSVENDKDKKDTKKSKSSKKGKNSKKTGKTPDFPKNFDFEFAKTKAMLAFKKNDNKEALEQLKFALSKAKKKGDKARLNFIIAQLLQQQDNPEAREYYTAAIKKNAPFEMMFNAKINRAIVSDLAGDQMIKELISLSKEERYFEFRDQIYYSMAQVELKRPDRKQAKYYLSRSAFYSINNPRQKGISYEKLGDMALEDKHYVEAQRYYDSSAQVVPETYVNYEIIKKKAEKLSELVKNIEIVEFEDSVQHIAGLGEKEREVFLKNVIKKLQKDEQERKEREAAKAEQLRKLQQTYEKQNSKTGSKFYFSNTKTMQEGLEDFKRSWGQRENTDYWRLTNKPNRVDINIPIADTASISDSANIVVSQSQKNIPVAELSPSDLMGDIPLTDSALVASNERLLAALFNAGRIYKDQLSEDQLAATQFQRVIDKNIENKHNVVSAFQLYKIYEGTGKEQPYREYILNNYPNSDYANYLRDPDYFIKKKERDELALQDYLRSVTRYEQGLYYPVIIKADKVIEEELDNRFREQYMLLKAMAMGRINSDKTTLLPVLNQLIEEFPESESAARAKELIDYITNGIPMFEDNASANDNLFSLDSKEYYVIIFLKENQTVNTSANNISMFNKEYFSRIDLSTSPQIYDKFNYILVKTFNSSGEAESYIKDLQRTPKHVKDYQSNEIFFISKENIKIMLQQQKLDEYRIFFQSNFM